MYNERYESMINHLLWQFQGKPIIEGIIYAVCGELCELQKAQEDLRECRWIDTGEGVQLDNIGVLIDRPRNIQNVLALPFFGFKDQNNTQTFGNARFRSSGESYLADTTLNDEEYRKILWAKVFKNSSLSTAEDTISIIKRIINVDRVIIRELGNANMTISLSRILSQYECDFLKQINLLIREAGVGVKYINMYAHNNMFGFKHQQGTKGFGVGIFARTM